MNSKPHWLVLVVIIALLASIVNGCSPGAGEGDDEGGDEVEIVMVERGSLSTSVTATGSVLPRSEVRLSFELSGRVSDVLVQEGEHIVQGDTIAHLDTRDLELQVRSAQARLASAQAQLDRLEAGPREEEIAVAEANVAAAQASLEAATTELERIQAGALDAEIAAAEAQIASAEAQQKVAHDTHEEMMKCRTVKLPDGSKKEFCPNLGTLEQQALYNLNAANEALEAAQAQLGSLQTNLPYQLRSLSANESRALEQLNAAQAQLDLLLAGTTDADIAAAKANLEQAQVALDSAQLALEKATLKAPLDGIVSEVEIEVGEFAGPQMAAVVLIDDSQFTIEADVDEADIGWIESGQEVQITLDAFPGHGLTGVVTTLAPSSRLDLGVVSYLVTIELDETDLPLRGGLTANTEIVRESREGVLLVPNRAIWIDSDSGQAFVERLSDTGETVIAVIDQGIADEQVSEILDGLEEGDQLIVRSVSIRERFRNVVTMPMTGQ